ncbi:MAG: 16S rRNA (adenine(1518)-N(6)/adenine(1519)-N(6))-dimethyltransferase RsmA [Actinomycetota bacterium]|nr:16S rRNA (adenine(1518)-N(6)/adenine(1519)-N(6))-dimethyltransferase RsmA [Actinomycetota bacterium]
MTHSRTDVQRLLDTHGLRPRRSLGQNFVVDPNTVRRIVRLADVDEGTPVAEVGAGLGSLTLALAETGAHVVAIETDPALVAVLSSVLASSECRGTVTVLEGDALHLDWIDLLPPGPVPWRIVANLPYNVATPVVMRVLESAPHVGCMLVMVQREVGERMAARTGSRAYGAVSAKIAYWATAAIVGRVPATVFLPRPKVTSVLIRIDRRPCPAVPPSVGYDRFCRVVNAGFGQRRKMLRGSLAGVVEQRAFASAGVRDDLRAEDLDVEAWGALAGWIGGADGREPTASHDR